MARNRRHDFSDAQRAEIFRRDRAVCVYSGRKLWGLDFGADWRFPVEWVDHVTAVANGGTATVENGVCAHWRTNLRIGASMQKPNFLFCRGIPTESYSALSAQERHLMADTAYLDRMERLDDSDWYFNRSLINLLLGIAYLHEYIGKRKRDDHYYAAAVLRFLTQWRHLVKKRRVLPFEERGLLPTHLTTDQFIMLEVRDMTSKEDVINAMQNLLPFYAETKINSA